MAERTEELKREIEHTREHMGTTLDAIGDRVSPGRVVERRWNRVRASTNRFGESVMGTPRQAASAVKDRVGGAAQATGGAAGSVGDTVGQAPDRVKEGIEGNPLAAGAVAFGLGVLLGSLAPTSSAEARVAEQFVEPLKEEAQALAQGVVEPVKEQVTQAVDQTKAAATDAASGLKEQAAAGTKEVTDHAASAGQDLKDQAKGAAADVKDQA